MKPRIMVLYYSLFGNNYLLAKGVCEGIKKEGGETLLRTVPELIPQEVIDRDERMKRARAMQKDVPLVKMDEFEKIDGLILGSPTRFGNMSSQLRNVLDQTTSLWLKGGLIGKPAGVFCSTASLHGGQETTLISMMFTLLHHGALVMGVPYSVKELIETQRGGTPYGPTAVVGVKSDNPPTEMDLKIAESLGSRVTSTAKKLQGIG